MSLRFLRFLETGAPPAVLLIRLVVGGIFLSEGIQKFLSPDALGAGRFAAIGILAPGITGPFVGGLEIIGGILLLLGLGTRLIAIPFLIEMRSDPVHQDSYPARPWLLAFHRAEG